jgi:acyl-coenzyme A synthetase/AMP-(fatty) acid ligase
MYTYDAERFKTEFERSFTWLEGFLRNVRRDPRHPAAWDAISGRAWSYGELNGEANRLANALKKHGLGPGDLLLYQLYNSLPFLLCYIAPQKLGAVNSPVSFNLSPGETARLLERDKPRVYVYDCDVLDMARKALRLSRHRPELILAFDCRGAAPELPEGHRFFHEFLAEGSIEEPERDFTPDMYAEVTRLCTSGTGGTPKGVPLNNVNEVLSAHDAIMHFPLTRRDVTLNMTPWFHRGGLHSGGPTPTLYAGGSLVILRMFSAKACFDCVEKYGVTFLIGVPSALGNLAARQEKHPADLSRLRGIVTMGSPLEREDCIRFQKLLTPNIFNGYGTTETFWNSFLRPWDLPERAGSAGSPCTDDEVRVVALREEGQASPEDTVPRDGTTQGEIVIRAAGKSPLSYFRDPAQTEEKYRDGWFYTRDVGTWDEEGFLTVAGRKDDMIVCMGENIYPAQLEEVINRHPKVRDCMVTGVEDPSRGQAVAAYVIPADGSLTLRELHLYCAGHDDVSGYKCPRWYAFVEELPYNATGKKQHTVLKARAGRDLREGKLRRP